MSLSFTAVLIWSLTVLATLLLAGFLATKLIRGRRIPLLTELPPMCLPVTGNVIKKTAGRPQWYLVEVPPLFLIGGLLNHTLRALS